MDVVWGLPRCVWARESAAVHGVAEGWTRLSDFSFSFHFHALEKEMAIHSSVLAWRIPGTGGAWWAAVYVTMLIVRPEKLGFYNLSLHVSPARHLTSLPGLIWTFPRITQLPTLKSPPDSNCEIL